MIAYLISRDIFLGMPKSNRELAVAGNFFFIFEKRRLSV
jgi:hypothetical protein